MTDLQPEVPFAIAMAADYLSVGVGRTLCTCVGACIGVESTLCIGVGVSVALGARVGGVLGGRVEAYLMGAVGVNALSGT